MRMKMKNVGAEKKNEREKNLKKKNWNKYSDLEKKIEIEIFVFIQCKIF